MLFEYNELHEGHIQKKKKWTNGVKTKPVANILNRLLEDVWPKFGYCIIQWITFLYSFLYHEFYEKSSSV